MSIYDPINMFKFFCARVLSFALGKHQSASLEKFATYSIGMSLTMHRGSPARRRFTNLSRSPIRNRDRRDPLTPPKKSSSHRGRSKSPIIERANTHVRSSPRRGRSRSPLKEKQPLDSRSPKHTRTRSPVNEKLSNIRRSPRRQSRSPRKQRPQEYGRSPKEVHSSSPIRDSSISPRTKRLRRAQIEHERGKTSHNEEARSTVREREKGRNRERAEDRGVSDEKRLSHEKNDGRIRSSRHAHNHSSSPVERGHRSGHGIHSPRDEVTRTRVQNQDDHEDSVSRMKAAEDELEQKKKQKPSFELSGKLAEETNRVRGVTLLFTEPSDARKPDVRWRLYVFKAGEVLNEPLYVHRQSCYLFGRERRVADIPTDHPSCSKQHAVLQYRLVEKEQPDGLMSKQVRPYLMDIGSTNGTFLNDERIEPQRYYELREQDVVKFGNSSREYVVLHENSVK